MPAFVACLYALCDGEGSMFRLEGALEELKGREQCGLEVDAKLVELEYPGQWDTAKQTALLVTIS